MLNLPEIVGASIAGVDIGVLALAFLGPWLFCLALGFLHHFLGFIFHLIYVFDPIELGEEKDRCNSDNSDCWVSKDGEVCRVYPGKEKVRKEKRSKRVHPLIVYAYFLVSVGLMGLYVFGGSKV